jgi:hypothetical protein
MEAEAVGDLVRSLSCKGFMSVLIVSATFCNADTRIVDGKSAPTVKHDMSQSNSKAN